MSLPKFATRALLLLFALQLPAWGQRLPADIILHNATIVTMNPAQPYAQAIAITGDSVIAVGSQGEINRLGGPGTRRVDLEGRTVIPGFVDPHNHSLISVFQERGFMGTTYDEAQQILLENGFTTITEAAAFPALIVDYFVHSESTRIRTNFNAIYQNSCGGVIGHWYFNVPWGPLGLDPPNDALDAMVRLPSVKFFADGGSCGSPAWTIPDDPGAPHEGDLFVSAEDLATAIGVVQDAGYQATIHAVGDAAIDTTLDAIELALAAGPNTWRHRIDHSTFTRPDQRQRYAQLGVIPVMRAYPDTCTRLDDPPYLIGRQQMFMRLREMIDANPGRPVSWYSHMGGWDNPPRSALVHLWGAVTRDGLAADGSVCKAPDWLASSAVSVEEALHMMTAGGAAAVGMDEKVGSLEVGKFADLVVLSGNPATVDPDTIKDLEVLATIVGGSVEYCAEVAELRRELECTD